MEYGNYGNRGYGGYNRSSYGGYSRAGYGSRYSVRYRQEQPISNQGNQRQQRKRSGAKIQIKDGAPLVSAWKKNKMGFYVLYARPYKNTKISESKNGKEWANLFVTITNRTTMETRNYSGLFDMDKQRLYIKELNMIVTKGGQGGYWGRHMGGNR